MTNLGNDMKALLHNRCGSLNNLMSHSDPKFRNTLLGLFFVPATKPKAAPIAPMICNSNLALFRKIHSEVDPII